MSPISSQIVRLMPSIKSRKKKSPPSGADTPQKVKDARRVIKSHIYYTLGGDHSPKICGSRGKEKVLLGIRDSIKGFLHIKKDWVETTSIANTDGIGGSKNVSGGLIPNKCLLTHTNDDDNSSRSRTNSDLSKNTSTSTPPTASYGVIRFMVIKRADGFTPPPYRIASPGKSPGLPWAQPPDPSYVSMLSQELTNMTYGYSWQDTGRYLTCGTWYGFSNDKMVVGMKGLHGCTSVVIISVKGVYISHIYEQPVFVNDEGQTKDEYFRANSIERLRHGAKDTQSITALIGTDANPGGLHAQYKPRVFVITPSGFRFWNKDCFKQFRYEDRSRYIATTISSIIPGSIGKGMVVGYRPSTAEAASMDTLPNGRVILEMDPCQGALPTDIADDLHLHGAQARRWRLWVTDEWMAYQDFYFHDPTPPTNITTFRDTTPPTNTTTFKEIGT